MIVRAVAIAIVPFSLGLRERRDAGRPVVAGATSIREALREASVHPGFWMLTAAFFVCGMHVAFVSTHLAAFLTDRGMSGLVAANALALMGLFNVIGSLLSGWIGNRFRHRYVLALMYASRTLIFLPMIFLPMSPVLAFLFASVMGLFYLATATPTSGIVAQVFARRVHLRRSPSSHR